MAVIKSIIDTMISILSIEICLFGYDVTLMNVAVFFVLGSLVMGFIYRLFD